MSAGEISLDPQEAAAVLAILKEAAWCGLGEFARLDEKEERAAQRAMEKLTSAFGEATSTRDKSNPFADAPVAERR